MGEPAAVRGLAYRGRSERPELRAEAEARGLVLPGTTGRACLGTALPAVAGAVTSALGLAADPEWVAAAELLAVPAASRVCVVLVDGLGHRNLLERSGHAPFLRRLAADSTPLTSTFPSTTATAMGTFGTGTSPGRTAMLGYTVRVPQTGALGNLVSWTDLPDPERWQPHPTVLEGLVAAGVSVTSVGPSRFSGSGLTRAALRGPTYRDAESLAARVDGALAALREPGVAYLYWGDVDKAGHQHGWGSWQWGDALEAMDAELGRLARSLPRDALLVVTADHGMVDVDPAARWDVAHDEALRRGVALVAGEPRALHLHLEPGVDGDDVVDRWRDVLGDAALVVTRDEAVAAGLFGPLDERVAPVIGDVVVATTGRATIADSRTQTAASLQLVGVHGSLTPHEMLVPWILAG
ncbi:alkaline phosphatase family protein [Cellulomonas composti]|uniref:Nucleotide pyrophosphatase n=1 Tax=Cellulomonas composti TaxID=266130 RepID=A0A511J725_9CELL|nr:nucleotide pyrophosphatase/phosphodiesterase family protein [Cellulomonas composti]GEL93784.1 nucleotide pyrophosphatase [Cellulomonas composti]